MRADPRNPHLPSGLTPGSRGACPSWLFGERAPCRVELGPGALCRIGLLALSLCRPQTHQPGEGALMGGRAWVDGPGSPAAGGERWSPVQAHGRGLRLWGLAQQGDAALPSHRELQRLPPGGGQEPLGHKGRKPGPGPSPGRSGCSDQGLGPVPRGHPSMVHPFLWKARGAMRYEDPVPTPEGPPPCELSLRAGPRASLPQFTRKLAYKSHT